MDENSIGRDDGEGGTVRLSVWNQPGDGIYGMLTRANGCMQVLSGSRRMGRVNHISTGEQQGADLERVEMAG